MEKEFEVKTTKPAITFKKVHLQKLLPSKRGAVKTHPVSKQQLWGQGEILSYLETCKANIVIYEDHKNGFFNAFLNAYNYHGDIKITPDDIWIVIMLYFSTYVNNNSEQLRSAFVNHEGKKELVITILEEKDTEWDTFFDKVIVQIRKNTSNGITKQIQCDFSTTTRIQQVMSTAIIMDTYKKYFDYSRFDQTECGIQNVHFGGNLEDWINVLTKTQNLTKFDVDGKLKMYVKNVSLILHKFIDTYQQKVDLQFWNKLVHRSGGLGSGSPTYTYSGWLIYLFGYEGSVIDVGIPNISVDIKITYDTKPDIRIVKMLGGFKAVSVENLVFRPHLSLAIKHESIH